ncbi:tyrosine-type recombinase/integrase, partial [Acidithiobacillus sp.]|uniref:tyrosine-type recombinase/integrase n=1 Tax=Acidithiobacillus sp. TaxID=1872118 RepID=UPI0025C2511B
RPYRLNRTWRTALTRAGIHGLRFHDLRHEATSRLVEYGLSDAKVRRITGHKTAQMLARYAHLRCEDLVRDLDQVQENAPTFRSDQASDHTRPEASSSGTRSATVIPLPRRRDR